MGYYIETKTLFDKTSIIQQQHGAEVISLGEARRLVADPNVAVICVISNLAFEAAAFCYDMDELEAFADKTDLRPRVWLKMNRELAKSLTGYTQK